MTPLFHSLSYRVRLRCPCARVLVAGKLREGFPVLMGEIQGQVGRGARFTCLILVYLSHTGAPVRVFVVPFSQAS